MEDTRKRHGADHAADHHDVAAEREIVAEVGFVVPLARIEQRDPQARRIEEKQAGERAKQQHHDHARIEGHGRERDPQKEHDRDGSGAQGQGGIAGGAQGGGGIGGQQKVAAEGAAGVAELVDRDARGPQETGDGDGAERGHEEAVSAHVSTGGIGKESGQRDGDQRHGAGARIARIEAEPVGYERAHKGAEECACAVERALPGNLRGDRCLPFGRALFDPDEQGGESHQPKQQQQKAAQRGAAGGDHGVRSGEGRSEGEVGNDRLGELRVLLEERGGGSGQESHGHHQHEQDRRSPFAFHQLIDEGANHPGAQIIAREQQQDRDHGTPEAGRPETVKSEGQAEFERQEEEPERVEDAGDVARQAAIGGGERIATQLGLAEDGAHAEADDVGGDQGLHEEAHEYGLGHFEGLAGSHRGDGGAESAEGHQRDEQQQQQVSGQKERDAAVAGTGLGPEQLVTERDQLQDQGTVHCARSSRVSSSSVRRSINGRHSLFQRRARTTRPAA